MITATAFSMRLLGDDVARLQVLLDRFDQHLGRFLGRVLLLVVRVRHGRRVGQRDAQRLERAGHGVGRVHAAAGAGAGNGALLDLVQVLVAHVAGGVLAHGLEHAHDVQVLALVAARQDGAAVHVDGRHVGAQHAHQAARHVLVAAADHQHAVHPLAADAGLDAVGNDFAAHQRVLHAFGAHGHAVGNGGRAEDLRVAAGFLDALDGRVGQLLQARVAGRDGAVAVGDADHRLLEVGFPRSPWRRTSSGWARGLAFDDVGAAAIDLDRFGVHGVSSVVGCGYRGKHRVRRLLTDWFQSIFEAWIDMLGI
jgi:hypothetical protein